ncbi:putative phosphoribosylformylglycinamidine synthase subunit PurS-like superfamily [Helianthus anomalus]
MKMIWAMWHVMVKPFDEVACYGGGFRWEPIIHNLLFVHAIVPASLEITAAEFLQVCIFLSINNSFQQLNYIKFINWSVNNLIFDFRVQKVVSFTCLNPYQRVEILICCSVRLRKRDISVRVCSQGVRRNASDKIRVVVSVDSQQLGSVDDFKTEKVIHFFKTPLIQDSATDEFLKSVQTKILDKIVGLKTEQCFNIGVDEDLSNEKLSVLKWILQETYEPKNLGDESFIGKETKGGFKTVIAKMIKMKFNIHYHKVYK